MKDYTKAFISKVEETHANDLAYQFTGARGLPLASLEELSIRVQKFNDVVRSPCEAGAVHAHAANVTSCLLAFFQVGDRIRVDPQLSLPGVSEEEVAAQLVDVDEEQRRQEIAEEKLEAETMREAKEDDISFDPAGPESFGGDEYAGADAAAEG